MIKTHNKNGTYLPKKVGIVYSEVKRKYFPTKAQYITEKDAYDEAKIIASYLRKLGIKVLLYPGDATLTEKLRENKPDIVLNLVASVKGYEYLAATIPAVLELLEIPYTGSGILAESLTYNKFLVKKLLEQNGVPVPRYQLFNNYNDPLDSTLRFPLISKLNEIHGAVEITTDAVSDNEKHLRQRLKFLINTYDQPVIVEEFIVGREITAYLFEGLNKKVYLAEKIFTKRKGKLFYKRKGKYIFDDFDSQWNKKNINRTNFQKYQDNLLKEYVKKAFEITRMDDLGKFDIRMDSSGRYFFLDSNSNPSFGPHKVCLDFAKIIRLYEISFLDIIKRLLLNTIRDAKGKQLLPMPGNGQN